MTTYSSREEIDEQYRWDLSSIFGSDEAFLAALEEAKKLPPRFASFQGKISASAANLLAYLKLDDEAGLILTKLANYAERKSDEDTRESRYQDYSSQVMTLWVSLSSASSWFTSELLSLSEQEMEGFYSQEPELELYRRCLDVIFSRREHVLSPAEEKLLAAAGDMANQPDNIFSLLNDADLTFPDAHDAKGAAHPVTHGSYIPLMMSADRTLRESAYESLYSSYRQFRNTFAATLGAQNKQLKFFAEARRYESALEAALSANEVPTQVYTNLIETVHNNMDAMYKYVALRKELLDVDELRFSDLYVPIVDDVELTFTYEEACDIILEALRPMGENYLALVRRGLSERWIDVYETPGKRSGAYSAGGYGMHPVILLNFQGKLDDVFTLIHEMGHSIHTYLSCANQPVCYSDYVIFVAEVASTCNEALLTRYLLDHAKNERERTYFLNHFLEQFRATLYRQTMFAEFELKVAELTAQGAGITADALCGIYKELNAQYFGDGIALDENIALEWARIPHFYYRFYVYQYATGFAAAIALSQRILDLGEQGREDYLGFLKGGSSKPPIDLLRGAGVDMLSPEPVEDALKLFDEMVDEMAEACRKLKAEKH
ncbi:MAG: oligoendopeptidase F [Eggerthella sp.]|nr:oligoendopeptidase F [Eggerthella sp.]